MELQVGELVRVRSRQYLVENILKPRSDGASTLVRLSCLEDDAQGDIIEVLWEHEVDAQRIGKNAWQTIAKRGFDLPRLFSAYLHTLRWNCVTATDASLFQAPYRAGIEVKAYQLEPLRKALLMPRVNLFIADDVGLGKTIEAGLILREMIIRQRVRRVVVSCPPSVVRQWHDEMEQRFGLTFVIFDREYVTQKRMERGFGVNPWKTHSRFIISHALLRDETYAAPLRDWLGVFSPTSMLILDEAHNAAPASGRKYAIDSKLTRTVRELAPRFEHKLFLSATPHNGHSNSFSALLEILDPQRFCRGVPVDDHDVLNAVMVRRLKKDLRALEDDFPERKVLKVVIDRLPDDCPELALSHLLYQYRQARETRLADGSKSKRAQSMLTVIALQKRLLSSVEAFARTLRVHKRAVDKRLQARLAEPDRILESTSLLVHPAGADDERADLSEDEVCAEEDAAMVVATTASVSSRQLMTRELELLEHMSAIAERARYDVDTRLAYLIDWIRTHLCPNLGHTDAAWRDRRVLVFTEYADTKRYLQEQLEHVIAGSHQSAKRVRTFHGGMGEDQREDIKQAFNADPAKHPLRILIATDAAREGVNLQNHCADLFHFDIPWNPSRMEQRNGRIDRKLQRAKIVHCYYFVLPQRAEDRVLEALVEKTATIQRQLGSLSPVVERRLDTLLDSGIDHQRVTDITQAIDAVDDRRQYTATDTNPNAATDTDHQDDRRIRVIQQELEQVVERKQKLEGQVERLQQMLQKSRQFLGLSETHFREAISASLEMVGATALEPEDAQAAAREPDTARFILPALAERMGADPSWQHTLDTLRAPRKRGQKPWEWRRDAPIRPVVFRDPGNIDNDVVHLHLEHRVVQRLLGRFLSQGFVHDELTRACIVLTDDAEPRVIAIGRLSLYGARAARLHDKLVSVAAAWTDPSTRGRKKLAPMTIGERDVVLRDLEDALGRPRLHEVPERVHQRLLDGTTRDVDELIPHLKKRAAALERRATRELTKRGDTEAAKMRAILVSQRERITRRQKQVADHQAGRSAPGQQLPLPGVADDDRDEYRQLQADKRYWSTRLATLEEEIDSEPDRVRASYQVRARRIEPVGIVYLWPVAR